MVFLRESLRKIMCKYDNADGGFTSLYLCLVYTLGSRPACLPAWLIGCVLRDVYNSGQVPHSNKDANTRGHRAERCRCVPAAPRPLRQHGSRDASVGREVFHFSFPTNGTSPEQTVVSGGGEGEDQKKKKITTDKVWQYFIYYKASDRGQLRPAGSTCPGTGPGGAAPPPRCSSTWVPLASLLLAEGGGGRELKRLEWK